MHNRLKTLFDRPGASAVPVSRRDVNRIAQLARKHAALRRLIDAFAAAIRDHVFRDPLTGLHNRLYFEERVGEELKRILKDSPQNRAGESALPKRAALLFIDLDGFKAVNDTRGHAAGDRLLKEVARVLDETTRNHEPVARYGGDEFAVFLVDDANPDFPRSAIGRLDAAIRRLGVSASIGSILVDRETLQTYPTVAALLHQADQNMYEAKKAGKRTQGMACAPGAGFAFD